MLKLREIELFGFKSFADRTRIPVPDDLLVVVGPNGSGKSNVTDAVLWALGEQSARQLRGHKMMDVIFGGSHKRPPSGMAEVLLLFEEEGGSKVQLGRRLLRAGESTYMMDGHPVRLKDVQDYMLRYAISTQGSFLVEQGRVEALLKASPEERRIVFEEVAGIVHYKENRRSALQKLEAAEANLLRLNDVLNEVETQMVALKRQAQKADRFVRLSEELRKRRRTFWGRSFGQLSGQRTALSRDLELFQKERQRRETALTQLEAELEEAKVRLSSHESSLQALIQKIHQRELENQRVEEDIKRKTDQILTCKTRLRQIAADLEQLKPRIEAGLRDAKRVEAECKRLEKAVQQAEEEAEGAKGDLEASRAKVEALEAAQEDLRKKAFELAQEHSRLSTVLARSEEDLKRQGERERRLAREREALETRERELQERLQSAQAQRDDLDARLQESSLTRSAAESHADELAAGVERAAEELAGARESQAVAEGRLEVLVGHEASLRSSAHAFLQARDPERAGKTLAEALSEVPEELVQPLASALGDLLEGYLDASWEGLPQIIAALSAEKAGQATFFLDGSGRRSEIPADRPPKGFLGWLHETEGVPRELRDRLPLVALTSEAEAAKRVAQELGVPAVGRDGLLFHPDGYVRGGSGGTGGASLLQHQRDVRDAEREVGRAKKLLEEAGRVAEALRAELREAQEALASLKAGEEGAREAFATASRGLEGLEAEARRLQSNRDLLEGETLQAREEGEAVEAQRAEVVKLLAASEKARAEHDARIRQGEETLAGARKVQEEAHEKVAQTREVAGRVAQQQKSARNASRTAGEYFDQLMEQERRLGEEAASQEARAASLGAEVTEGQRSLGAMLLALQEERTSKAGFEEDQRRFARELEGLERQVKEAREALDEVREEAGRAELALATVDADVKNLAERMGETFEEAPEELAREFSSLEPLTEEERQEEAKSLVRLEGRIQELGAVNMLARQEYDELEQRHTFLSGQRKDLEESVASLQETIRKINRTTRERFMEAFDAVQQHFAHLFKEVFEGGEARLSLLDEANPLETGVEIYAQPPGKKLQNMLALSGGEKAMVALALLFSLFMYRPQPFFLLDEVDAPLDEANINRFSRLLVRFQGQTQFLVVSHNKRTMELAEVLYGVTMAEGGVSKLVSVRLADVEEQLGVETG